VIEGVNTARRLKHRRIRYIPGRKKSVPPFNFFTNGDKIIIFRDRKKKFIVCANYLPLPPKRGSLWVS
jgi:hypothetical protein